MTSLEEQLQSLNENFGLPGVLAFDVHPGTELVRAQVTLPEASATIYLHGAHITHWQPAGQPPVLFLSERSEFEPAKAIRGGIPICFPWFGPRQPGPRGDSQSGPSHGFARITPWAVSFAALIPSGGSQDGDSLRLTLMLSPDDLSRSLGFDHFRVACEFTLGKTLSIRLSVVNLADAPLRFEEALHTYFHVGDVRRATITGLEGAAYLDKRDEMREKHAPAEPLRLSATTDRVFPANSADTAIHDEVLGREIAIAKTNSATTVVWNPWAEVAKTLADLDPEAWPGFLCVEAANTGTDTIVLAPRQAHTMELTVSLK
jgi:glucose-6-phosphate 1-epimerase